MICTALTPVIESSLNTENTVTFIYEVNVLPEKLFYREKEHFAIFIRAYTLRGVYG